ncbi:hypothetical protein DFAR_3770004 [Desulfarculales bacterium]
MAWLELKKAGFDPQRYFRQLRFANYHHTWWPWPCWPDRSPPARCAAAPWNSWSARAKSGSATCASSIPRSTTSCPLLHSTRLYP